jgi:hypothetical protein
MPSYYYVADHFRSAQMEYPMNTPTIKQIGIWLIAVLQISALSAQSTYYEEAEPLLSPAELDQMLAPIALYPDVLLSQVLMASTYPLEVVEAARWTRANPELDGESAMEATSEMRWDQSVRNLVAFPDLLQLMDENLAWTRKLGEAFLLQKEELMERVQVLRSHALEEGTLNDMEHVTVDTTDEIIIIEPARTEVVYVPYYSTRVVYGDWWWYDYPPVFWRPRHTHFGSIGFHWGKGFRVSTHFYFTFCDWRHRDIIIRHPRHYHDHHGYRHDKDRYRRHPDDVSWKHDPEHRRGARYKHEVLRKKFRHTNLQRDRENTRLTHKPGRWDQVSQGKQSRPDDDSIRHPGKRGGDTSRKGDIRTSQKKPATEQAVTTTKRDGLVRDRKRSVEDRYAARVPSYKKKESVQTRKSSQQPGKAVSSNRPRPKIETSDKRKAPPPRTARPSREMKPPAKPPSHTRKAVKNPSSRKREAAPPPRKQPPPPKQASPPQDKSYNENRSGKQSKGYGRNSMEDRKRR